MHTWMIFLCFIILSGCADAVKTEEFTISNETALDKKTDLMWATTDNRENLTRQEAVDYCESYSGGGFQDWRMPKTAELQALIKSRIGQNTEIINLSSSLVWASETDDSKGAFCNFKERKCAWMEKVISISLRALPVRDTKTENVLPTPSSPHPMARPQSLEQRLQVVDLLRKQKLITEDEYNLKKTAILDEL